MNARRTRPDGLEAARLLYAPPTSERAVPAHILRNLARALAYAAGLLYHAFPEEVREAYRRGLRDGHREAAGEGGQTR